MKLKTVYSTIALIFVVVGIALWKLNDTYRTEKISVKQNQLQTQLTALRSSLVSQISQLRNTLSAYTGQIDESKINWVQLKPFYALAVVQEDGLNRLTISKLFLQSGSVADRWNATTLQKYLQNKVSGNQLLRAQTFKDSSGLVHLTLSVFDREKRNNQPRTGVMVVGDVSYFQRFFDLQRTSSITQVLLNADKQVAAHSEYEYVGNQSDENKISESNFFVDRQEIRGTNLNLLSYSSKKGSANLDIPLSILGIIIGLAFLMSGVLLFAAKPDKELAQATVGPAPKKAKTNIYSEVSEEGDFGIGLGDSAPAPTPRPLTRQVENKKTPSPQAKPNFIPLSFDEAAQIVPIQVQACAQQALFNVDRQLKSSGVSVAKEFVSGETVTLDYPKFIKIFENVLLTVAQSLTGTKKRIQLRSYDADSLTTLEIQAPVPSLNLHEAIFPVLVEANCEFSQVASSAGEAIFRFTFTRPEELEHAPVPIKFETPEASDENRFELTEDDVSGFTMPEKLTAVAKPAAGQNDLDIDALLSLDDEPAIAVEPTAPKVKIEKEMQPSKFKLDEKMSIVEDPVIDIETSEDTKADKTKVKIRRPEKG